jgi:hypothetical protein
MSDEHVANAVRVLNLWRLRAKKQNADAALIRDLRDAIDRFKRLQRRRLKSMPPGERSARKSLGFRR